MSAAVLDRGFADPVFDAQRVFRATMSAMARPGTVVPVAAGLSPPAPLTPVLAAVALTLLDHETPVWLDAPLAAQADVGAYLRFHTGATLTPEPGRAAFALVAEPARLVSFAGFAQGTDAYPDRSTTVLLAVERFGAGLLLSGPGIDGRAAFDAAPLPAGFAALWAENRALFPCGVDIVFCAPGAVAALPRSTRIAEGAA